MLLSVVHIKPKKQGHISMEELIEIKTHIVDSAKWLMGVEKI